MYEGLDLTYELFFIAEETKVSTWRSKPTGRMRLTVGDYGERQSYPPRKDGTYNYENIAYRLRASAERSIVHKTLMHNESKNVATCTALKKELGIDSWCSILKPSSDPAKSIQLAIQFVCTPERAKEIVLALRKLGIQL